MRALWGQRNGESKSTHIQIYQSAVQKYKLVLKEDNFLVFFLFIRECGNKIDFFIHKIFKNYKRWNLTFFSFFKVNTSYVIFHAKKSSVTQSTSNLVKNRSSFRVKRMFFIYSKQFLSKKLCFQHLKVAYCSNFIVKNYVLQRFKVILE